MDLKFFFNKLIIQHLCAEVAPMHHAFKHDNNGCLNPTQRPKFVIWSVTYYVGYFVSGGGVGPW